MDVKDILKLATNPLVLGALGGYLGHYKYSKKYGHVLPVAGGAIAGALAGALVQKFIAPATPVAPPVKAHDHGPVEGVTLDFSQPPPQLLPPEAPEGVFAGTAEGGVGSYNTPDGAAADAAIADVMKKGGWEN